MKATTDSLYKEPLGMRAGSHDNCPAPRSPPLTATHAQLGQDRRVAHIFAGKRGGTFVDVGASDGVRFSNTLALERDLGWRGVCVEPEPEAFAALQRNRPDAFCSSAPLLDRSGQEVTFAVRTSRRDGTMLSGIEAMFNAAAAKKKRHVRTLARMTMRTETLPELLDRASMPASIDYLTLDTEGSELAVLRGLEGSRYTFKVIHVEHNYREPQRTVLRQYLQARGYKRTAALSWDDEYTLREAKPATEASAEAAPEAHETDEAAPQAHETDEAAPQAHETDEAAPQAHETDEAAPQAHETDEAAPEAHETDEAAL